MIAEKSLMKLVPMHADFRIQTTCPVMLTFNLVHCLSHMYFTANDSSQADCTSPQTDNTAAVSGGVVVAVVFLITTGVTVIVIVVLVLRRNSSTETQEKCVFHHLSFMHIMVVFLHTDVQPVIMESPMSCPCSRGKLPTSKIDCYYCNKSLTLFCLLLWRTSTIGHNNCSLAFYNTEILMSSTLPAMRPTM